MPVLINGRPNWIIPLFRQTGNVIEYKRFPADYMWRGFLDLSSIIFDDTAIMASLEDIDDAIVALMTQDDVQDDAIATAQAAADAAQAAADAAQDTADDALAGNTVAAKPKNRRVTLWHDEANVSGGTFSHVADTLARYNSLSFTTVTGVNAVQSFACDTMPACKFFFLGVTAPSNGIMQLYIDETAIATVDWWSAGTVRNVIKSVSFVASAIGSGRHTIRLEVTTKNASSSGFSLTLTKYWLSPDNDFA